VIGREAADESVVDIIDYCQARLEREHTGDPPCPARINALSRLEEAKFWLRVWLGSNGD